MDPDRRPRTGGSGAAETAKAQLRGDLKTAMRERAALRMRVLRSLIAALDNAEAVSVGDGHVRYTIHAFGDKATEVPRLVLGTGEVKAVLRREADSRREAAAELAGLGRIAEANALLAEAAIVDVYLA